MYSVTLLVILLAVFNQASSMPDHVYLLQEASGNNTFECVDLPKKAPGDPYDCDSTPAGDDYEVKFPNSYTGNTTSIFGAHEMLRKYYDQGNVTKICKDQIAQAMCNIAIPACHKDKKKIVSFLTKKTCQEDVDKCLKDTGPDLIGNATEWCMLVPGNNAKMFKYADAFNSGTKIFCAIPIFVIPFITLAF